MPNKRHARFGLKKFQLCDDNGYVYHIEIYAGKELDVHHDEGHAFGVLDRLLTESSVYNKGYHLYTDNFYTKPKLLSTSTNTKLLSQELLGSIAKICQIASETD